MYLKAMINIPCQLSISFMSYGFFAVLCQLVFMVLNINILLSSSSLEFVSYMYAPFLEYPLLSFTLIIGGSLLFDYLALKEIT